MKSLLPFFSLLLFCGSLQAQYYFHTDNSIPVFSGAKQLKYPWAGGLNNPQFGSLDLNGDGIDDLVVFNRGYYDGGHRALTFINGGTPNQVDYSYEPWYANTLPPLNHWMLTDDYNCDGTPDFITWEQPAVMALYTGTRASNGHLSFTRQGYLSYTTETGNATNIFVSAVDIPAVIDVNNDGDFDVLTFSPVGFRLEYFENLSVETNNGCGDTLGFAIKSYCWSEFNENGLIRAVELFQPCGPPKDDDVVAGGNRHVGSTVMAFDENGDGLKEILLGDVSFDNFVKVSNGGTLDSAVGISQDTLFPSYNRSVQLPIFPAGFYTDVNNDGRKDLLVGPNSPKKGFNYNCSWYYKDVSTNANVQFEFQTDTFLVNEMIDLGEGSYPAFVDVNGDDLLDMVVGNNGYYLNTTSLIPGLALFINVGTTYAPAFKLVNRDYLGLSTFLTGAARLQTVVPAFGDMNGDGALDMIIGDHVGYLHYFRNIAPAGDSMRLVLQESQFKGIDVGNFAKPEIFDVNGDGLNDLIVGRATGNLHYFENTGTSNNPNFSQVPTNSNFGEVNVKPNLLYGESTPRVAYLTHTNQPFLVVGNIIGNVAVFELDVTKRYSGVFTEVNRFFSGIDVGEYAHLAIADIDNDGKWEMAVGSARGGINIFKETNSVGIVGPAQPIGTLSARAVPNPSEGNWQLELQGLANTGAVTITVYNMLGQALYSTQAQPTGNLQTVVPLSLEVSNGIYICRVQQGENSTVLRLLAK